VPPVIGTAGHIDHGKTALVRALTGQDTDRLKEEKERGISIDLGFAYLDLPGRERVGVVDVPGHERFIRNMLAGAHGIDVALLVVAADDGVMPQTEEHLDILHLLGVTRGVVAVTKTDLVDEARVRAALDEIRVALDGTSLATAPIVPVSSATGAGLAGLRAAIDEQLARPVPARPDAYFRLPVDRVFSLRGPGLVVTGTALAGDARVGDTVRVLPDGGEARVRSLETHGAPHEHATGGRRLAVGLAGIERDRLARGAVVCHPAITRATRCLDAWVEIRPAAGRVIASHTRVRLHLGTAEVLGRVVVHDGPLAPRGGGWARLVLREPVAALRGDRFVLRDETARRTIGGGEVARAFVDPRVRRAPDLAAHLAALRGGDDAAAAGAVLALDREFATDLAGVAEALNRTAESARLALAIAPAVVAIPDAAGAEAWTTVAKWQRLVDAACAAVADEHREHPLARGLEMESLRGRLPWVLPPRVFRWAVDRLVADGLLGRADSVLHAPRHAVRLAPPAQALADRVERLLAEGGLTPPDVRGLEAAAGASRRDLLEVLRVLDADGRVVRVSPDLYFARAAADEARARLERHCGADGTITPAAFRDLIGASRKFAIALLEWLDRTAVTVRVGDLRRLRRPPRS
jgi:selenocysteine-specific elongation factor